MTTYRLIAFQGKLYFPHGGMTESSGWDRTKDQPALLLHVYPEGDYDAAPWPLTSGDDRKLLAAALFDARECNEFFESPSTIELPDGSIFDFDSWVN